MTVKAIAGVHHYVCGSSDTKSAIVAPPGSRLWEFTTGSPDTAREYISFGGGVWALVRYNQESSTA